MLPLLYSCEGGMPLACLCQGHLRRILCINGHVAQLELSTQLEQGRHTVPMLSMRADKTYRVQDIVLGRCFILQVHTRVKLT